MLERAARRGNSQEGFEGDTGARLQRDSEVCPLPRPLRAESTSYHEVVRGDTNPYQKSGQNAELQPVGQPGVMPRGSPGAASVCGKRRRLYQIVGTAPIGARAAEGGSC